MEERTDGEDAVKQEYDTPTNAMTEDTPILSTAQQASTSAEESAQILPGEQQTVHSIVVITGLQPPLPEIFTNISVSQIPVHPCRILPASRKLPLPPQPRLLPHLSPQIHLTRLPLHLHKVNQEATRKMPRWAGRRRPK